MLSTKAQASSISGVIACAGTAAFQAQTAAASATPKTSVPQTQLRGPANAPAMLNSSMSPLPITTGPI
jgi:hypothetical protein